jgi:hypothetical protein
VRYDEAIEATAATTGAATLLEMARSTITRRGARSDRQTQTSGGLEGSGFAPARRRGVARVFARISSGINTWTNPQDAGSARLRADVIAVTMRQGDPTNRSAVALGGSGQRIRRAAGSGVDQREPVQVSDQMCIGERTLVG